MTPKPQKHYKKKEKKKPRCLWPQRKILLKLEQGTYDPLGKTQKEIC
jgi:hypothetical protein